MGSSATGVGVGVGVGVSGIGAAGANAEPQEPQNREPSGSSLPHVAQVSNAAPPMAAWTTA